MNYRILIRQILVLFSACVATVVMVGVGHAQGVYAAAIDHVEAVGVPETVRSSFEGTVLLPDGAPASGFVVVSTAGGQAITNAAGEYRLEAQVPVEARSVRITAAGGLGGKLVASQKVSLSGASLNVPVVPLQLAHSSSCSPSWLPTFGSDPGVDKRVFALAVFDDGNGAALYAGGTFETAGGVTVNGVGKWDGTSWSALGSAGASSSSAAIVYSLAVFDDGSGAALYVGGSYTTIGGVVTNGIAKWDGVTWAPLGTGMDNGPALPTVSALEVFDDGSGPSLFAGGRFLSAGGVSADNIAKWDGASWTTLATGMDGQVWAFGLFDDGNGMRLYAGGDFDVAGGVPAEGIARWSGSAWSSLNSGFQTGVNGGVYALTVFDDGTGPALYVGGHFDFVALTQAENIARWDGTTWSALGSGTGGGVGAGSVSVITAFDDGGGAALYIGGSFLDAGGVPVNNIVKWNGGTWTPLGNGVLGTHVHGVYDLVVFDAGNGAELFAGGKWIGAGNYGGMNIARWTGSSWMTLGHGVGSLVSSTVVFDDGSGPALYAGGVFLSVAGTPARRVAKWDGSNWAPLGTGIGTDVQGGVNGLTVFDDGTGPALYAAGFFSVAGTASARGIAKWDGSTWSPLGNGSNIGASSMAVFDDGTGAALYAVGGFPVAGGMVANGMVSRWDGSSWTAVGTGTISVAGFGLSALAVFDDGNGDALYAGGDFTSIGGIAANAVAKWDGTNWHALGTGLTSAAAPGGRAFSMAVHDDGSGDALYVGGEFMLAGGVPADQIAKWDGSSWASVGSGMDNWVSTLTVFDDGNGERLIAGGLFLVAGGVAANRIASWDGSSWSALGSGTNGIVLTLLGFDDGGGEALFVGGGFTTAFDSGDAHFAKWGCSFGRADFLCNGDGGDGLGCVDCPCSNNTALGTVGGCLNSVAASAQLVGSGSVSVSLPPSQVSDLRFSLSGATPLAFCVLNSGDAIAPLNSMSACFGLNSGTQSFALDGLRCAVLNTRRHGGRSANANGEVGANGGGTPWGGEGEPVEGLAVEGGGFAAGQTRYFQVIYGDDPMAQCMRGLNTSQAVEVTFEP